MPIGVIRFYFELRVEKIDSGIDQSPSTMYSILKPKQSEAYEHILFYLTKGKCRRTASFEKRDM